MVNIGVVHALAAMHWDVIRSLNEAVAVTRACESSKDDFVSWETVSYELSTRKELMQLVISRRCLVTDAVTYYHCCTNMATWYCGPIWSRDPGQLRVSTQNVRLVL